nr:immunoglobulin light chain junction region [Macaca mulatta]
CYQHSSEWTF